MFFLTVLWINPKTGRVRHRCWGYFHDEKIARECIERNLTDIFEDRYYDLAVIEKIGQGIAPMPEREVWFRAEYNESGFIQAVEIKKPCELEDVCFFAF